MGLANPFKSKTNNALENVMYFAERCYAHPDKIEASLKLDDLRKVFLRKIQADQIALSYMSPIHSAPPEIFNFQLFGPALGKLVSEKKPETVAMKETLDLAQAGILRHCCKVSDEAAFCLIQRPYISKTLLTRRISPRGSP